jgi:hypothetical protein
MEPEDSLPCSQQPTTGPYPEPDASSTHILTVSLRSILILSSHLRLGVPSDLYLSGIRTKILYTFFLSLYVLLDPPISPSLILSP